MTTWVHFTDKPENFDGGLKKSSRAVYGDGILVYKVTPEQDIEEKIQKWSRTPIYFMCDDKYVSLEQGDPLGTDPTWDEYFIKSKYFNKVMVC